MNQDVTNCRLCGTQIIWGELATPEQRAASVCIRGCAERLFVYSCMYKSCGRLHRFGRFEDLRFECEHAATVGLKPAFGFSLAFCIRCSAEVVLNGPYDAGQQPLCDACVATAPRLGPWDHLDGAKHDFIIGLDEVGWGSLAGPLMVGAAVVPRGWRWPGLRDSKDMSTAARERLIAELEARALGRIFVHVERMEVREFEQLGAENALLETHRRAAVRAIDWTRQHFDEDRPLVIIDGKKPIPGIHCQTIVNADDIVPAVMTAAIVAKTQRDHYMTWLHQFFPAYKFDQNFGYGEEQAELVKTLGGCEAHRRNYNPLKKMLRRRMQQLPLFEGT